MVTCSMLAPSTSKLGPATAGDPAGERGMARLKCEMVA